MVGLKSVWLLLFSLFLFGACVPQSKQSECGSNEAFNSQLRSCVPIVQGPTAFINISSYSPLYTSTRFKNDTSPVTFTIAVSNPYNQTYTIEWEHSYNGSTPTNIDGNVLTTSQFIPSLYSGNVGSNIITAKIISGGKVVDSHNFEVVLQDNPTPNINTATISPADYYPVLYGDNTGQPFSFTGRNNGAVGVGNYRVYWNLSQNGVSLPGYSETDTFANTSTNGTNVFYYGTSVTPRFDPSLLGLGSYVLRVRMESLAAPGVVVAEHQWNISVRDRDFGFVSSAGLPFTGTDTIAFHDLSYDDYPFANSIGVQSEFCVTLSDPDGAYTNGSVSDPAGLNIVVKFYKDGGGSPIYEGTTTPVDDTVCFSDAGAAEKASLIYNDGSATVPHYRTLTARAYDEQTGREICASGLPSCPVTYPLSWRILVKPLDTGVIGAFQPAIAGDNITYTSTGSSVRSATVTQSDSVTIRFKPSDGVPGYEGYDMSNATGDANSVYFTYDIVIKKSGVTVDTISCKAAGDPFPWTAPAVATNDEQFCTFTWPGFNDTTGEHLDPGTYVAYLQVTDTQSPVPGSNGTVSNALTINASVSEPVNPPRFNPAPDFLSADGLSTLTFADEGDTIRFRAHVEEDEHDDYTFLVEFCGTDATCAPASRSTAGSDSRVYGSPLDTQYLENTAIAYNIPDDVLGTAASGTVYFRYTLTDSPTTSAKSSSTSVILPFTVNNANAAPTYNSAAVTPSVAGTYEVFSGYQFTGQLNAAITDLSNDASEKTNTFQWWISSTVNNLNMPGAWTAIEGATSSVLRWTPGPELTTTSYIAVCYSDGFPRTLADDSNPPNLGADPNQRCQSVWTITPRTNSSELTSLAGASGEVAVHHVPAERIAYVAYASNNSISVEKVAYETNGTLGKPMNVVTFDALSSGTSDSIKNLSLASSDTSLFVAYLADATGSPGTSFRAHIRRINISKDVGEGGAKTATVFAGTTGSTRKFGFSYAAVPVVPFCTTAAGNCVYNAAARTMTFNGGGVDATDATQRITVNGEALDFEPIATKTVTQICSDCDANSQAQSFASAINAHPSLLLQGLTASVSGSVVTLHGVESDATDIYSSTQAITAAGKILFNPDNNNWYWPVANADFAGGQNRIQLLRGVETDVNPSNDQNVFTGLDTVSAIDNAWSTDAPLQMYMGYINLSGAGKVTKFAPGALGAFTSGVTTTILPAALGISQIQISPPIGTANPNVFVASRDNSGSFWMSRLPAALGSHVSYEIEDHGADAGQMTLLDKDNVSQVYIASAQPPVSGGTTDEARLVVVSKNLGVDYQSYLFRWKTVASEPVLESTVTFDRHDALGNLIETSSSTKLAGFAPTSIDLGHGGAITSGKTNNTMGIVRLRDDGVVEFNLLNTEVESINSTTNDANGNFRASLVK